MQAAGRIVGHLQAVAEAEPEYRVQNVMQAEGDQGAVKNTINKPARLTAAGNQQAESINPVLYRWPDVAANPRQQQADEPGHDRHQPFASEERQEIRQFGIRETVVTVTRYHARDDPGEEGHVNGGVNDCRGFGQHQETDSARQGGSTGVVFRQSNGDAERKEQGQAIKNAAACAGNKRNIQHVGLTQT